MKKLIPILSILSMLSVVSLSASAQAFEKIRGTNFYLLTHPDGDQSISLFSDSLDGYVGSLAWTCTDHGLPVMLYSWGTPFTGYPNERMEIIHILQGYSRFLDEYPGSPTQAWEIIEGSWGIQEKGVWDHYKMEKAASTLDISTILSIDFGALFYDYTTLIAVDSDGETVVHNFDTQGWFKATGFLPCYEELRDKLTIE